MGSDESRSDIFGMHANTLQGADVLATQCGYRIVVPDFFRGLQWDVENIPPREGRPVLDAWIQKVGSWEIVRPDLLAVVQRLKDDGAITIAVGQPP
jgi:dienelactone hydrolase